MPASRDGSRRRFQCKNNLKQIGLALHNYHDKYKEFPPAYTVNEHGKPLHSWRTLILPFVEQQSLYQRIDLSKPWNDPANAEAFKTVVPVYMCPSLKSEPGMTTYLAVIGDNTGLRPAKSLKLEDVTDGTSNTLAVVDVTAKHAVNWMSPHDADLALLLELSQEKDDLQHAGGYNGLLFDGSVRLLSSEIQESIVRALVTATANDEVGEF
ncbi:MAG: DUF1559 domain-containing protein [Planctomycetaceae bacterium]